MGQDASNAPCIKIGDYTLEVVDQFIYLGSTIGDNLSIGSELNKHIGMASAKMFRLPKRVWENQLLTDNTKIRVYQACILSTLLYVSETWMTSMRQEGHLNTFHMR